MQYHNHDHDHTEDVLDKASHLSLAHSATLHCLLGCGIGEVVGVVIGTALGLSNTITLVLAVVLGFVFGFILGMRPLLRASFDHHHILPEKKWEYSPALAKVTPVQSFEQDIDSLIKKISVEEHPDRVSR